MSQRPGTDLCGGGVRRPASLPRPGPPSFPSPVASAARLLPLVASPAVSGFPLLGRWAALDLLTRPNPVHSFAFPDFAGTSCLARRSVG